MNEVLDLTKNWYPEANHPEHECNATERLQNTQMQAKERVSQREVKWKIIT